MHAPFPARSGCAGGIRKANAQSIYLGIHLGHCSRVTVVRNLLGPAGGRRRGRESSCYTLLMKALVITSLSGPDALAVQDVPEPTTKSGQIMVRVSAGGVNFADFMTSKGGYPGT